MTTTTLILLLFLPAPDAQTLAELFDVLDKDGDGKVVAAEISDAQQPYFQRSLRVADRNEDGALTRAELTIALTDPQPVQVNSSIGRGNFDPSLLDRNMDGYISKDEVPAALQERFKRGFEQYGDRIPVNILQSLRGAGAQSSAKPKPPASPAAGMPEMMMQQQETAEQRNQLAALVKRLDVNKDGMLSPGELKDSDAAGSKTTRLRTLDRNNDGQLSKIELAIAMRSTQNLAADSTEQRPTAMVPDQLFRRLDKNGDDQLTADEIPQRMRQMVRRAGIGEDKMVTLKEFRKIIEQQAKPR